MDFNTDKMPHQKPKNSGETIKKSPLNPTSPVAQISSDNMFRGNLADHIKSLRLLDEPESHEINQFEDNQLDSDEIPSQVVKVFSEVGKMLRFYRSGKLPRAIKIVPSFQNWTEILAITNPEKWSKSAVFAITKLYASNFKADQAEIFYREFLLDIIRNNIELYKKLNPLLFKALKKCTYKPSAFYKGFVLSILESGCTVKEAKVFASVIRRLSIPMLHSCAAVLMMLKLDLSQSQMIFLQTILQKKYRLPKSVVQKIVSFFTAFADDESPLPVAWHQTLLVFVSIYNSVLDMNQKEQIRVLLRAKAHTQISAQIEGALDGKAVGNIGNESDAAEEIFKNE